MPVTTTESSSCPTTCPHITGNCYAKSGFHLAQHWKKVTSHERGGSWSDLCDYVSSLKPRQIWRHNQAGDLPGDTQDLDSTKCVDLAKANKGKRGFTYTHYDVLNNFQNAITVNIMNHLGFTVNVSANNLDHADKLCDMDIAPVATVLPIEQTTNTVTPKGRKVLVCPATYKDDVSCASCMLCEKWDRNVVVGFPAHGTSKKKAAAIAA